jgi:hypothetical protein
MTVQPTLLDLIVLIIFDEAYKRKFPVMYKGVSEMSSRQELRDKMQLQLSNGLKQTSHVGPKVSEHYE